MNNRIVTSLCVLCAILSAIQRTSAQGSLTPPGAPAPTMKTLQQVEPRTPITNLPVTITQPGSYYLTGNLTCSACTNSQNGITVSTGNVSIDLNGFALQGVTGSANGILGSNDFNNCIVRNGTVSGWGGVGISLPYVQGGLVLECSSSGNHGDGIDIGISCVARDCSAGYNGGAGISSLFGYSTVSGCTAFGNSGVGINAYAASTVTGCAASENGQGIFAVESTVSGCTANQNSNQGIVALSGSTVSGCTVEGNALDGITVDTFCYVFNNTASGNSGTATFQGGIHATGNGNRIDSNHSFNNTADGILVDTNATANVVIRNTSNLNSGFQFRVPGIPTQPPAGANIVGRVVTDATNVNANAWANFQ